MLAQREFAAENSCVDSYLAAGPHAKERPMDSIRILVIAGSERAGSLNRKLAGLAGLAARTPATASPNSTCVRWACRSTTATSKPRSACPPARRRCCDAMLACDAMLVVTPEYNGFPTPLVINAFDWLSRITASPPRASGLAATANKPVALLAASPGPLGGLRSMNFLRQYLQMAFAMLVVPQQFALGRAAEAFDDSGPLKDARAAQAVDSVVQALDRLARAMRA